MDSYESASKVYGNVEEDRHFPPTTLMFSFCLCQKEPLCGIEKDWFDSHLWLFLRENTVMQQVKPPL